MPPLALPAAKISGWPPGLLITGMMNQAATMGLASGRIIQMILLTSNLPMPTMAKLLTPVLVT